MDINNFQSEIQKNTEKYINKVHNDFMNKMKEFKSDLHDFRTHINVLKKEHLELETEILKGLVDLDKVYEELGSIEKSVTNNLVRIEEEKSLE